MKKRQLIATLSCLLVGMIGFAGAYALDHNAESGQQQEAEVPSTEMLSQVSGIVEPETDSDSENTDSNSEKSESQVTGTQSTSEALSTTADLTTESSDTTSEGNAADGESTDGEEDVSTETSADSLLHFSAELRWPLDEGSVILDYSMDHMIYFPTLEQYQYNPAMIISASVGDKVYAAAEGVITDISTNEVTGLTVTEDLGDGYIAVYGQLADLNFEVGDTLERGHVLGYVAEPTKYYSVEGANLYFAIQLDGEAISPLEFLEE